MTRSAAYVVFEKDGKVLLMRRKDTGWMDGMYGLPSGHVEDGESPTVAAAREALEETGARVDPTSLRPVHVMHRSPGEESDKEYYDFFFIPLEWQGEPSISEPSKCDELGWFAWDDLPDNIVPSVKAALNSVHRKDFYSER